jgi:hypothetical protein
MRLVVRIDIGVSRIEGSRLDSCIGFEIGATFDVSTVFDDLMYLLSIAICSAPKLKKNFVL